MVAMLVKIMAVEEVFDDEHQHYQHSGRMLYYEQKSNLHKSKCELPQVYQKANDNSYFSEINIYSEIRSKIGMRGAGPCGIPENTGIPGLDSNTDTGIFENKIPVFFGIFVQHTRQCFQRRLLVFSQLQSFWGLPEPLKVLQIFTLQTLTHRFDQFQQMQMQIIGLSSCQKIYQDLFLY